jgi:hypothetical protein
MPLRAPFIAAHDPDIVEYILKTNFPNYIKGNDFHNIFVDLLGEGIFNSDGAQWKKQR